MKPAFWFITPAVVFAMVGACLLEFSASTGRAVAAPPLNLEKYLNEKLPEAAPANKDIKVDNSACYVCHGNYQEESLVVIHAKGEVGCVKCHGRSDDHCNDEDNVTPPEKMYAPGDVDKMCSECHETHNAPAYKVVERWQQRCPAKAKPKDIVCTDCHFRHRLAFRTVWWDKKTRKLVIRKEGQRTKPAVNLTKPTTKQAPRPISNKDSSR